MAITAEYRLKKLELDRQLESETMKALADLGRMLLTNPIVELVGGITAVEMLRRYPASKPILGGFWGGLDAVVLNGAITGILVAQQIAPSMPYLASGASDLLKLLPAIGAATAA
jgi:hypothetical protein